MDDILCDLGSFFDVYDAEEDLTSIEFFRLVTRMPAYKGAVRLRMEIYAHDHQDEVEMSGTQPVDITAEQLRNNPRLGAAPAAGQMAPLFNAQVI